ncbi:MAG TPA: tetratricopeptide repeat protein [Thermoanaerobaculia bacterium]|nr:tetratricopeptide repeat protein [Thermoanaerobaculia bacterium]
MPETERRVFEFGPFRLDSEERVLLRDGQDVALPPRLFDVLRVLVERGGRLVRKDDLLHLVWKDAFVEEGSLTRSISRLRQVLEGSNGHPFIETVAKSGYRFIASVRVVEPVASPTPAPTPRVAIAPPPAFATRPRRGHGLLVSVAALVIVAAGLLILISARHREAIPTPVRSVAVLPFTASEPSSPASDLGLQLADQLATKLGGLERIAVRPLEAVTRAAKTGNDPIQVGRDLGVDWVLDGTIQRTGERAHVAVRLTDAREGRRLWTAQLDEPFGDPLALSNAAAAGLAAVISPQLSARDREILTSPDRENLDAYQLYMKGRLMSGRRTSATVQAIDAFEQAIRKDPTYALAYAGLADSYALLYDHQAASWEETAPAARRNALKAVALGDSLAESHLALAWVRAWFDWNWTAAQQELRRASELRPNDPEVYFREGSLESETGRFDAALRDLRRAEELDPVSPLIVTLIGKTLRRAGRLDLAFEELRKAEAMDPESALPYWNLGLAYEQQKKYDAAIGEFLKCLAAFGVDETEGVIRRAFDREGPIGAYRAWLERLQGSGDILDVRIAQIYEVLGQPEKALEALERGVDTRAADVYTIGIEPSFENLHGDSRFQQLLRRMNVPPAPASRS